MTNLAREPDNLSLLHNKQRPLQRMARVSLLRHEFSDKTLITRAPPHREAPPQLALYQGHLLVELSTRETIGGPCRHGIHGGEFEQTNGFLDVVVLDHWCECHFCQ